MKKPTITVKVTLTNSHGVSAEDTIEEEYPEDLSAGEVKEAVQGFGRGFRNMMQVMRMNQAGRKEGIKSSRAMSVEESRRARVVR